MKRMLIATCAAVACAVSLAAQTPAPAGQDKPAAKAEQSSAAEKSVTMKGCLRAGDQADSFVLANAAPATTATGTTGTAASAPATTAQTVRLIGAPAGMSLKDHVGHTVEVTGMITPAKASTPAGTSGTPAAGAAAPGAASSATQSLNVKTVKHVDAKCGGA